MWRQPQVEQSHPYHKQQQQQPSQLLLDVRLSSKLESNKTKTSSSCDTSNDHKNMPMLCASSSPMTTSASTTARVLPLREAAFFPTSLSSDEMSIHSIGNSSCATEATKTWFCTSCSYRNCDTYHTKCALCGTCVGDNETPTDVVGVNKSQTQPSEQEHASQPVSHYPSRLNLVVLDEPQVQPLTAASSLRQPVQRLECLSINSHHTIMSNSRASSSAPSPSRATEDNDEVGSTQPTSHHNHHPHSSHLDNASSNEAPEKAIHNSRNEPNMVSCDLDDLVDSHKEVSGVNDDDNDEDNDDDVSLASQDTCKRRGSSSSQHSDCSDIHNRHPERLPLSVGLGQAHIMRAVSCGGSLLCPDNVVSPSGCSSPSSVTSRRKVPHPHDDPSDYEEASNTATSRRRQRRKRSPLNRPLASSSGAAIVSPSSFASMSVVPEGQAVADGIISPHGSAPSPILQTTLDLIQQEQASARAMMLEEEDEEEEEDKSIASAPAIMAAGADNRSQGYNKKKKSLKGFLSGLRKRSRSKRQANKRPPLLRKYPSSSSSAASEL